MIYYYGSETVPPCAETVRWIINMKPHVITQEQIDSIKSLFTEKVKQAGGNNRGTVEYDATERTIYKFSNKANTQRLLDIAEELKDEVEEEEEIEIEVEG